MDTLIRAAGLGLLAVLLGAVLKKENPAMAFLAAAGTVCVILAWAAEPLRGVVEAAEHLAEAAGISSAVIAALWKTTAIGLVTRVASAVCIDGGQTAAAAAVEMTGSAAALWAALPLMETVVETVGVLL